MRDAIRWFKCKLKPPKKEHDAEINTFKIKCSGYKDKNAQKELDLQYI